MPRTRRQAGQASASREIPSDEDGEREPTGDIEVSNPILQDAYHMQPPDAYYLKSCVACQRYKAINKKPAGLLQYLSVDLFSPLPRTPRGNNWILVAEDVCTEVFLRYGVRRRMISDNGVQFVAEVMQQTCHVMGIKQSLTPLYHPEANPVERKNRDLKPQLAILVGKDHTTWDTHLAAIRDVHERAQAVHKRYADKGRRPPPDYKVGDLILLKTQGANDTGTGQVAKFIPRRDGPYRIREVVSPTTYLLEGASRGEMIVGLGLGDAKDITVKGLEIIRKCDKVLLEGYTSILTVGKDALEEFYGRPLLIADRELCESGIDDILQEAKQKEIALLVVGDPLGATTHTDMLLRAKQLGVKSQIVHNASIMNAVSCCGLQLYNFGETVSVPYWTNTWKPDSYFEKILNNYSRNLHTLCLLGE
ncbi:hypothetical protein evm_012841 [Chilo suppressalis]|nr:hypothetical protein evm_012841 [Chilo suppressalis]